MKFIYKRNEKLPSLSWVAEMKTADEILVIHGAQVECHENFFVAGVWDGDFEKGEFDTALSFHGTGAVLNDINSVSFVTPTHLQESVYSFSEENRLVLSNSIPFLLSYTDDELDADYYGYEYDLNSIFFGKKKCVKKLKTKKTILNLHRYCNLVVNSDLSYEERSKGCELPFSTFDEYKSKMLEILGRIIQNASDAHRLTKYKLVTTISSGYDASAVSALVHEFGCNTALTFSSPEKYREDSGVEVAQYLGYTNVIEGDGEAYRQNTNLWEAESAAGGDVGCLVPLNTFEDVYKDSLLFLGLKGDCIFGKDESEANRNFDFISMSIAAEQNPEHYLRNNTIAISVPLILGYEWPSIYKISNSPEMQKFSVGGNYDRPIPRRIVEEKGVPRVAFGFKKKGAGFTFRFQPTLHSVQAKMSPTSYESLLKYKKQLKRSNMKFLMHAYKYYMTNFPIYINYALSKLRIPFSVKTCSKYVSSPISSLLILWGMDVMTKKYKDALE